MVTSLFLNNDDGGKISGTYKSVLGQMQSAEIADKMKKSNPDEYFKDLKKNFTIGCRYS
jgi:hypothetical protein